MNQRDRQILQIALPSIVSNITVPLLGMIDVAIVGHMGSPVYIGAVAVGSMIFNLVYWLFGFLRMGSSGLTAQALGRRDFTEITRLLWLWKMPEIWLHMRKLGSTKGCTMFCMGRSLRCWELVRGI